MKTAGPLLLALAATARGQAPDTSADCLSCQDATQSQYEKWTNATTVAELVEQAEAACKSDYRTNPVKKRICQRVAAALIGIPEQLFEGMATLAWPIPLAPCAFAGMCKTPCCEAGAAPEQVRLSLNGEHTYSQMRVSWLTLEETDDSVVQFGTDVDTLTGASTDGHQVTYTRSGFEGAIHRATMEGLSADTRYYYRVGNDGRWSETFSFVTFSEINGGREARDVGFAVVGDMGYGPNSDATVAAISALVDSGAVRAVIHSGDESYADGYNPHWDLFMNKIQPIASRVPYMFTPGNHEIWYNFSAYKTRLWSPSESDDDMFYGWKAAGVHFASANSEARADVAHFGKAQVGWLDAELDATNRTTTPWVVANFHRPMYCTNDATACDEGGGALQYEAEDVLVDHSVDLVLTGHVHSYERTFPVAYNELAATGTSYTDVVGAPVHVVQGASGNRENNHQCSNPDPPDWAADCQVEVGFGLMTVAGTDSGADDSVHFEFFSVASGEAPALLDDFTLVKTAKANKANNNKEAKKNILA